MYYNSSRWTHRHTHTHIHTHTHTHTHTYPCSLSLWHIRSFVFTWKLWHAHKIAVMYVKYLVARGGEWQPTRSRLGGITAKSMLRDSNKSTWLWIRRGNPACYVEISPIHYYCQNHPIEIKPIMIPHFLFFFNFKLDYHLLHFYYHSKKSEWYWNETSWKLSTLSTFPGDNQHITLKNEVISWQVFLVYIHMCTLYTFTDTYMQRFCPCGFFSPFQCLGSTPGLTVAHTITPRAVCVCVRVQVKQTTCQNLWPWINSFINPTIQTALCAVSFNSFLIYICIYI